MLLQHAVHYHEARGWTCEQPTAINIPSLPLPLQTAQIMV